MLRSLMKHDSRFAATFRIVFNPRRSLTVLQLSDSGVVHKLRDRVHRANHGLPRSVKLDADADAHYGCAAFDLALIYRSGYGKVPIDLFRSAEMFRRSASVGHKPALFMFAQHLAHGDGVGKDMRLCRSLLMGETTNLSSVLPDTTPRHAQILELKSDSGDDAVSETADVYRRTLRALFQVNGNMKPFILRDLEAGSCELLELKPKLERMSDLGGDCLAARLLGQVYWELQFFERDADSALLYRSKCIRVWSRLAEEIHDAIAQRNLALVYFNDPCANVQRHMVIPMLTTSAEQNDAHAQYALASSLHPSSRNGALHNVDKSRHWLQLSANNYDSDALKNDHKLGGL